VNWPVARKALDEAGYNGWLTIETADCLSRSSTGDWIKSSREIERNMRLLWKEANRFA